ncbi:nitroreductase family protein [Streptomyces uncialis]|uniref:nitroreductase family protein n=1 Tax=Streptomyces uncialis TaxID=1048205 RepID=UPI0033C98D8E
MPDPALTDDVTRAALARARSGETPGPDVSPGTAPVWTTPAQPLTSRTAPAVDRVLRHSLAAARAGTGRLRPVPSAGALHPVDAHLLVGGAGTLPAGRYAYDALTHHVHLRGPAPDDPPEGTVIVLTVRARRTVSHYGHRALPLLLLDAGHAVAALVQAGATELNLDADGALLSAAAGLPNSARWQHTWPGTEPQHPLAAVTLGAPHAQAHVALERWAACPLAAAPRAAPRAEVASPALRQTWRALDTVTASAGHPGVWTAVSACVSEETLLSRRSAAPPLRGPVAPADLARVLACAAAAATDGPQWCVAVGGTHPALLEPAPAAGHPADPALRPLACGETRPTLAAWAAGQGWIAEAGAVLLAHGCPDDADSARIRHDHLAAGYAAGRAQSTATRLGLASRPIGSWQQADLGAATGEAPGRDWIVHGLALGKGDRK